MPDAAPMVDIADIQRLVGPASFQRGLAYSRGGAVASLDWDPATRQLSGAVVGSGPFPYSCRALILAATGKPTSGICTCPVGFDCKHIAALLLQSNTTTLQQLAGLKLPKPAAMHPEQALWKSAVVALTERPAVSGGGSARIGLLFELRELIPRSRSQWNGPSAKPATASSRGAIRLGVRPVLLSATGNWTRGNISWNSLGYQANRLDLATNQQRWFAHFAALHRSTREVYSEQ